MPPLRRQPLPEREHRTIELPSEALPTVDVRFLRSSRSRHVRINVDESGAITVSAPRRASTAQLERIVRERADWIIETLDRFRQTRQAAEVDLDRGDPVRYRGGWLPARVVRTERARARVTLEDDSITIAIAEDGDPYAALTRFYRDNARDVITERVAHWSTELGLSTGKLSIRDQRTRWGSCTSNADLSFNWRLILAPAWVLDAIVVHELCHIDELNHGARFWALLDERYPRHRDASEWLRVHGPALRVTQTTAPATRTDEPPVRPRRGRRITQEQSTLF